MRTAQLVNQGGRGASVGDDCAREILLEEAAQVSSKSILGGVNLDEIDFPVSKNLNAFRSKSVQITGQLQKGRFNQRL
jgi:hypothetical protein